jgi:hypothetical protein
MSPVPGVTLKSCWSTFTTEKRTTIADQLGAILTTLRSVRQIHGAEYIDENATYVPHVIRWLTRCKARSIMVPSKQATSAVTQSAISLIPRRFNDAFQFWFLSWLPTEKRFQDPVRHLLPDDAAICFSSSGQHPVW